MKLSLFTSLLLFFIILNTHSQADNLFTLYQHNTNIINPAYAGSHETLDVGAMKSWINVDMFKFDSYKDTPNFFTINIHSPISKGIGLGFSYENAEIEPFKQNDYNLDLSYKYNLKDEASIAAGVNVGRSNLDFSLNSSSLLGNGTTIQTKTFTLSNIGSGVYFKNKKWHAGLAYSYYYGEFFRVQGNVIVIDENYNSSITNGFVAYLFTLSEKIKLKPSLMIINSSEMDKPWFFISGQLYFKQGIEIGLHYNFSKAMAVSINTPLILDFFKIGLQVDFIRRRDFYYKNLSFFTTFNINAFGKKSKQSYF